jgi:hypothetical protein
LFRRSQPQAAGDRFRPPGPWKQAGYDLKAAAGLTVKHVCGGGLQQSARQRGMVSPAIHNGDLYFRRTDIDPQLVGAGRMLVSVGHQFVDRSLNVGHITVHPRSPEQICGQPPGAVFWSRAM